MRKKRIISSILIIAMFIATFSQSAFASDNTSVQSQKASTLATLTSKTSESLSEAETDKLYNEYLLISDHVTFLNDFLVGIDKVENEPYIFEVEMEGMTNQISLVQNSQEKVTILFEDKAQNISNEIQYFKNGKMLLDGKEISTPSEPVVEPKVSTTWGTTKCPYGSPGDYTVSAGPKSNPNVPLGQAIADIAVSAFYSLLAPVIGKIASAIYSTLYSLIKSQDPRTTGLSYKANRYYHKNQRSGGYIPAADLYVTKYNYTWYSKVNYRGSTTAQPAYECKRFG